jgi:hypothetical protein
MVIPEFTSGRASDRTYNCHSLLYQLALYQTAPLTYVILHLVHLR